MHALHNFFFCFFKKKLGIGVRRMEQPGLENPNPGKNKGQKKTERVLDKLQY